MNENTADFGKKNIALLLENAYNIVEARKCFLTGELLP